MAIWCFASSSHDYVTFYFLSMRRGAVLSYATSSSVKVLPSPKFILFAPVCFDNAKFAMVWGSLLAWTNFVKELTRDKGSELSAIKPKTIALVFPVQSEIETNGSTSSSGTGPAAVLPEATVVDLHTSMSLKIENNFLYGLLFSVAPCLCWFSWILEGTAPPSV